MTSRRSHFRLSVLISGLIFVFGVVGCSSSESARAPGVLPDAFPNHSSSEIRSLLTQASDTLHQFSAEARVHAETPKENRSFNAEIRQQRADSLFMRFSLFGFEGGRMLLTPDSVFVYDSRKQTLRVGAVKDAQQVLPVPVAADDVFANMLGIIAPDGHTRWTVRADSAHYYLTDPSQQREWTIDARNWRVLRYKKTDGNGALIEERRFSNHKTVQGLRLPHRVVFQRPQENLKARIDYERIQLNPSDLTFKLEAPANIPRTPLR